MSTDASSSSLSNTNKTFLEIENKPLIYYSNNSQRKKLPLLSSSFMDESGNEKSPICNIVQDHLFSILLLLPINSILSFAQTCKKFNNLASSDALWESICRREWGPTCVDSLKASNFGEIMPWMKLFKVVAELESVSCLKLSVPIADNLVPCPRASHSINFVSNCLVLFGGGCEGGRHLDDTWVAHLGYDLKTILKWQKVTSGLPCGRFGHTCVVNGDFLILFGGINDHGIRQNDTWIGNIVHSETIGITMFWRLLDVGSAAPPPPRGAHAGCCMENRRMLIHGGIGPDGVRLGDLWILEISENFCYGTWHEILTHPSPPPRSGHSLTCINDTQTLLFGGRGLGYDVLDDVWVFDASEGHSQWELVQFDLPNTRGSDLPRVGHSATLILGGKLLIYGGEDSQRHRKNDFWLVDANSIKKHPFSSRMWRRIKSHGYKPKARSFHAACSDHSGRLVYMFGGMVDGLLQPAVPSGLRFDGDFFAVELCLTG